MKSFKGYLHRWYATTMRIAPFTDERIRPVLKKSTDAAIKVCTGGETGRECGFSWAAGEFDGLTGAGQQMNALAAVSSLLVHDVKGPVTAKTGGTSKGDPSAGTGSNGGDGPGAPDIHFRPITTGDKVGAAILTVVVLGGAISMFAWMCLEKKGPEVITGVTL